MNSSAPIHRMAAPEWVLPSVYMEAAGRVSLRRARARNDSTGTPMSRLPILTPWLIFQWGIGSTPTRGHQNSVEARKKPTLIRSMTHMWVMAKLRAKVRKKANIEK